MIFFMDILASITMSPLKSGHMLHCSKTPPGTLCRLYNSAGRTSKAPRFRGSKIYCKIALQSCRAFKVTPRNYRAFEVRPAEFWSNATSAPLSHGDIVTGAKIPPKIILNLDFSNLFGVILVNHCHFRDLYNQYDYMISLQFNPFIIA